MKKLFALILTLVFVLSASCAFSLPAWLIDGAWMHVESTDNGMLLTSMYLFEDGKVYYSTQLFLNDAPASGRSCVGSWEFTGEDTIHVIIGEHSSVDLTYYTYNMMYDNELRNYYFRAEMRDGDTLK